MATKMQLKVLYRLAGHRWPKLGAQITTSFDTVLHIKNDLKTLNEKFNIVVKT